MDEDVKLYFVGDIVEIVANDAGNNKWIGFQATVEPWPEEMEQYEDGILNNWLSPNSNRPDGFAMREFAWPTRNLKKVD